jgi:chemotaxis regulatin CheY-phosphate phosphatase CheZ
MLAGNRESVSEIKGNVTEIIIAQNYQDLASQSIMKSINNIRGVEASLIALTRHTNVLRQISQFTANPESLNESDTEELCVNLEKLDMKKESDHMDQDDVDNLLSSLGF